MQVPPDRPHGEPDEERSLLGGQAGRWRPASCIPPGVHIDVAACFRSFERMRALADVIFPSHDAGVLKHPVYPVP